MSGEPQIEPLQRTRGTSPLARVDFFTGHFQPRPLEDCLTPKSKHIQIFGRVACAAITRPFSGLPYEKTRAYLLCSRRRWLLSSRMCYLFHNNLISIQLINYSSCFPHCFASVLLKSVFSPVYSNAVPLLLSSAPHFFLQRQQSPFICPLLSSRLFALPYLLP